MVEDLQGSDDERLKELGNILETQSEALRASISTTLRTQLAIWRSDDVAAVTSSTTPGWTVEDILVRDNISVTFSAKTGRAPGWHQREDGGVTRGSAATVYLIVPPEKMATMRSVLRVMLGQHLSEAIRVRKMIDAANAEDDSLPAEYLDWPMMFVFDEMPQLGYMRIIEDAVAITRSYRIRLWLFAQDLAQLEEVYPKWRSLVANCRGQIFFRPNDTRTAEHVAERLGRRKDIWGGEDWVASPPTADGAGVPRRLRDLSGRGWPSAPTCIRPTTPTTKLEGVGGAEEARAWRHGVPRAAPRENTRFRAGRRPAGEPTPIWRMIPSIRRNSLRSRRGSRGRKNGSPPDPQSRSRGQWLQTA